MTLCSIPAETLTERLRSLLGPDAVITDMVEREAMSCDLYAPGAPCAAVIRPGDAAAVARAIALITESGYAVIPRGGGMSYTGGYTPSAEAAVMIDLSRMNRILAWSATDMTLTTEAGATWESIEKLLAPEGLRLPFFGTFSGRLATVGGGLSNGALFFGSARYGAAADQVLGLEVVCADGRVITTGQAAFSNGKPFYRRHGPDLTDVFLHDCGALGIKTQATLRLIERPQAQACLSFALPDAEHAAAALSAVARAGLAEEAYVFDPSTTERMLRTTSTADSLRRLGKIVGQQGSAWAGIRAGWRALAGGRQPVPTGAFSLHLVCAGRSAAGVRADAIRCRALVAKSQGREIANAIPAAVRAAPFDNLKSVLGPAGERWVALNAKVPHSDASTLIRRFEDLLMPERSRLDAHGVEVSTLYTAIDNHAFSFEPVFHWPDTWLPPHRKIAPPAYLATLREPPANPQARALVSELREATLGLFSDLGAASNQLGRCYPWRERLAPETGALIDVIKNELDPHGLMNPGVLGLGGPASAC